MQILSSYPIEVRNAAKGAEKPLDEDTMEIEVSKLVIDAQALDARRIKTILAKGPKLPTMRVVHWKKNFYVVENKGVAVAALRLGREKVRVYVIETSEDEGRGTRKEKPHYAHSAVVTDKPTS